MGQEISPTILQEAQKLLTDGYHGIQKDVAAALSWPVGRVAAIKKGRVVTGARRYGSPNSQVQAVVLTARRLIQQNQKS